MSGPPVAGPLSVGLTDSGEVAVAAGRGPTVGAGAAAGAGAAVGAAGMPGGGGAVDAMGVPGAGLTCDRETGQGFRSKRFGQFKRRSNF